MVLDFKEEKNNCQKESSNDEVYNRCGEKYCLRYTKFKPMVW